MDSRSKKRILWGLLLLLVLINLSAIVTFSYNKYQRNKLVKEKAIDRSKDWEEKHKRIKYYLKKELQLDSNQFITYCKLKDDNIENTREIIRKIGDHQKAIIAEINKEMPDDVILEELSDSVGMEHKIMQMEMNRHFLAVKSILNSEQTKKFEEMLNRMEQDDWMRKKRKFRNKERNNNDENGRHRHRYRNGN